MVVRAATRALDIWMNGERVGVWYASRDGVPVFQYHDEWHRSPGARALSVSLPMLPGNGAHRGMHVASWFDNLLPDSAAIRERVARRLRVHTVAAPELLAAIGRDCVGAVQIVPAGTDPGNVRRIEADPLDEAGVARLLRGVTATGPLGLGEDADDLRISITGAQEKTALLRLRGRWYRPKGATPTTHLLKLPLGLIGNLRADMRDSVENEWLCMHLLTALGLPVAQTEIATFEDEVSREKVLVVERFDRELVAAAGSQREWIVRFPQEDFCQATGTAGTLRYESDGGPGIAQSLALLAGSELRQEDSLVFAKTQLAFWLLAATDGHAKNFSIFLRRHGYIMTPLYDVLSAWPIIGRGARQWAEQKTMLAMALRGRSAPRVLARIGVRHWRRLAEQTGVSDAFAEMVRMVEGVDDALKALESALPAGFPERVWGRISVGVRRQQERFLRGVEVGG
ncbi:MAG: HipA domain-containing protein [Gemmatimonadaceae bacterium]|nr:HipA domain-containing protein [Gemmatimonadaceae bacterium]